MITITKQGLSGQAQLNRQKAEKLNAVFLKLKCTCIRTHRLLIGDMERAIFPYVSFLLKAETTIQTTCGQCSAEFLSDLNDWFEVLECNDHYNFAVTCPCCGATISQHDKTNFNEEVLLAEPDYKMQIKYIEAHGTLALWVAFKDTPFYDAVVCKEIRRNIVAFRNEVDAMKKAFDDFVTFVVTNNVDMVTDENYDDTVSVADLVWVASQL